jgi:lysophospholipase L1-like esterase
MRLRQGLESGAERRVCEKLDDWRLHVNVLLGPMARSATSRSGSPGEPDVVVTVIRGHAEEGSQVFKWGEESGRLSVGSRGDWRVSGPSVMPVHLWLNFDGQRLFAARGEATAFLQGRQLDSEWTAVQAGAELRFGFALLRVARPTTRSAGKATRRTDPTRLVVGIAAGLLLTAALVVALVLRSGSSPQAGAEARANAVASTVAEEPAATPDGSQVMASPRVAEPVPPGPALADALPAPVAVFPSPAPTEPPAEALAATLKPPPAYPQNVANRPVPRIGDKPWLISEEWRAHHERHLHAFGRATAKVIFLGDSITEGWIAAPAYREHFGKYSPLNFGIANDMTQNVLWRVEHGALDGTQPQAVVLMVGVNNLAGGFTPEQTADGVRAIVTAIQTHVPTTRVLVLGVLPARQGSGNPLRQSIKDANRLLQGLAKAGKVEVRDVGPVLLEPDGSIAKATMRDFIHPTADGFARLSQAMAPFLDSMLAQTN